MGGGGRTAKEDSSWQGQKEQKAKVRGRKDNDSFVEGRRVTLTFQRVHSNGNGVLHSHVDWDHHISKIRDVQGDHAYINPPGEDEETVHACPGGKRRREIVTLVEEEREGGR